MAKIANLSLVIGTSSWREQFVEAFSVSAGIKIYFSCFLSSCEPGSLFQEMKMRKKQKAKRKKKSCQLAVTI